MIFSFCKRCEKDEFLYKRWYNKLNVCLNKLNLWKEDFMFERLTPLEKEWRKMEKEEFKYLQKQMKTNNSKLNAFLEDKIPTALQDTLDTAFFKAFNLVFEKGTTLIEKTYNKEAMEQEFQINEFTAQVKGNRKSLKKFTKKANNSTKFITLLSGVSGVGLGLTTGVVSTLFSQIPSQ